VYSQTRRPTFAFDRQADVTQTFENGCYDPKRTSVAYGSTTESAKNKKEPISYRKISNSVRAAARYLLKQDLTPAALEIARS
jgi:hypothetical protein